MMSRNRFANLEKAVGGERECLIISDRIALKRVKRLIDKEEFAVLDDYYEEYNQMKTEAAALQYIKLYAPENIQKFFPKLKWLLQAPVAKPTYSDVDLQTKYGYVAGEATTLENLQFCTLAQREDELVIAVERVVPFENLALDYQKLFFGKGTTFLDFCLVNGVSVEEYDALSAWLMAHISPHHRKLLDYTYTHSNWGLTLTGHPVILDLGYFLFS